MATTIPIMIILSIQERNGWTDMRLTHLSEKALLDRYVELVFISLFGDKFDCKNAKKSNKKSFHSTRQ